MKVTLRETPIYCLANYVFITCSINDMVREDIFYSDVHQDQFATKRWNKKFDKISNRFKNDPLYHGLKLNPNTSLGSDTREQIDFQELSDMFKSTDVELYEAYKAKYFDDKVLRFLNQKPIQGERVSYLTYTRSGNTFLRKYMELITGVITGSEFTTRIPFPLQLQGLVGEFVVDDNVFVIKSHFPLRFNSNNYSVNKILSCIRNPFNVIRSNYEFFQGQSHQLQIANDLPKEDPETWDGIVKHHVTEILNYFNHLMVRKALGIPIFFTRFEIITKEPEEGLTNVFKFLYNMDNIEGTNLERRINDVLSMGAEATQTYRMKKAERKYACDEDMYNEKQTKFILTKLHDYLTFFGYWKPRNEEEEAMGNKWGMIDYPEYFREDGTFEKCKLKYCEYLKVNEETMKFIASSAKEDRAKRVWNVKGGRTFSVFHKPKVDLVVQNPYFPDQDEENKFSPEELEQMNQEEPAAAKEE
eukprot:CAMPEP_0168619674 /NCGR_PEP_ID=MMETSP0449_2-20121227/6729_1 /TAXON_ID=1082188 /ORGANISM="Strombidium rassoulzadegani, Strain ras09" /LENGTH=471 /DNA_ID=CAMNT_0008660627 /DNA_START=111 /DNA_END=1526 /DNA_ORIENTATION=-